MSHLLGSADVAADERQDDTECGADLADNPKAHGDLGLGPTAGLEVMVERRGDEYPTVEYLFGKYL